MKMTRNTFFSIMRIIMLFIAGLVVAVFIALSQINLESLRGSILSLLRDATGLPVEIDGNMSWKFSLRPRIQIKDVRVSSADWATCEYAFRADHIDITLDLISLFHSRPTIQNVRIYDASVCVEQNEAGQYSVNPFEKESKHEDKASEERSVYPFKDPGLGGVEVRNLTMDVFGEKYFLDGFNVRYAPARDYREYSGWIKSSKNMFPFIVRFSEYNAERKVYPMRIALSTGGDALIANIALEGTSKLPIDFIIKGDVPNFKEIGEIMNLDLSLVPPITVNISGGMDHNKINIHKSSIVLDGDVQVALSGSVDWTKQRPVINADIHSSEISLMKLFPNMYKHNWKRPNRDLNVFHDTPLFGKEFLMADMKIHLVIDELLVYRNLEIQDIDIDLNITNGIGYADLKTGIGGGKIHAVADVDIDSSGRIYAKMGATGREISVGEILNQVRVKDFISELPVSFDTYVEANGTDLSEIMQTITGPVLVYSTAPGYAHSELVENIYGTDFITTLRHNVQDLFRSEKKHDQIKISCAVVNTKLRSGIAETQTGVAAQTNALNVRLAGGVNLGQETMQLSLITVPVRGLKLSLTGNVVNSIEITGNLAEPDVKINPAAVAGKVVSATGLGLLLAPFTGGLGLVAGAGVGLLAGDLLENWLADDSPCKTAMEHGAPEYREDPDWMNIPVADLIDKIMNKNKGKTNV